MQEELLQIKNDALSLILEAETPKQLEEIKLQFLGKSGKLTTSLKKLPTIALEERPEIGRLANDVKTIIEETIQEKDASLKTTIKKTKQQAIDYSIPGITPNIGHLHPMTHILSEVIDVFKKIGFQAAEGPEIETDYYNFKALNIPEHHPARDTQQTLYLDTRDSKVNPGELLLRTHTSGMQGRVMEKLEPPFRVIVPGKVFRNEQVDASHGFEFWQVEGFCVAEHIRLSDLFGTLEYFLQEFFGKDTKVKFVCHNFPFVEPGAEAYMSCTVCKGKGCSFCKQSGWVELLGAGMVHPNVLQTVGIDASKWQGFAFGTGLSRIATLKYHMDDLRLLTNPDLRIINQF